MSFNLVECGDDSWIDIVRIVLLWIAPVVLFVLRKQLPRGARHAGLLTAALVVASAIAALLTLPWIDVVDRHDPVYPMVATLVGWASAAALTGIYLRRSLRRRSPARVGVR